MLDSLPTSIVVISIFFSILATIIVGLRFYCRKLKKLGLGIDDWLILPALLFAIGLAIVNCIGVYDGNIGEHMSLNPDGTPMIDEAVTALKIAFVVQVMSYPCFAFAKLSILFFYRRIFRGATFNLITWILIALSAAWGLCFEIVTLAQCVPITLMWTSFLAPGSTCIWAHPFYLASPASDFIIDIFILTIPWPNVWQLQMPVRQKLAILAIFMLGAFICGIGIARFVFFVQRESLPPQIAGDITFQSAPTLYWTQLEGAFAVICACLPTLRPLFQGLSPESIFGSRGGRIFSLPKSKTTSKKKVDSEGNSSSIALRSTNSLSKYNDETSQHVPNGAIRIQKDLNLFYSKGVAI